MFTQKKNLKSTLATVAAFITDLKDGIKENETKNVNLQKEIKVIEDKKAVNTAEIETGKKLLEKLQ